VQAGAVALFLAQFGDVRPADMMTYILDAAEPTAVSGVQPNTSTKLLNVANLQPPIVSIKPRNWYGIVEGTSHTCVVSLQVKPTSIVMLLPVVGEPNTGAPPSFAFMDELGRKRKETNNRNTTLHMKENILDPSFD
jgi:hypothetical protein